MNRLQTVGAGLARGFRPRGPCYTAELLINLDHNATTPLDSRVRGAMIELLEGSERIGNPSSVHGLGRAAKGVVEAARRSVAAAVGAEPLEVTFTSGGTEADNLAILGACGALQRLGRPSGLLVSPLEHPAVRRAAEHLRAGGCPVAMLPVDPQGRIEPRQVADALRASPEIGVLSVAMANHELGNLYDLPAIVEAARSVREDLVIHTDAVQAFGKVPLGFGRLAVDLLSISAHKVYGPTGAGALIHRRNLRLDARSFGGQQERGRRVGTEAVLSVHGLAVAAELAASEVEARRQHVERLRVRLLAGLANIEGARVHGDLDRSTGNTVNVGFEGCPGDLVCMNLDLEGIAVSTGAACSAGTLEPSEVLLALGLTRAQASQAVRVSLGKDNRESDVDELLARLPAIVERVRAAASRRIST